MHMVTGLTRTQDGKHLASIFTVFFVSIHFLALFLPLRETSSTYSEWNGVGVGVGDASTKQGV